MASFACPPTLPEDVRINHGCPYALGKTPETIAEIPGMLQCLHLFRYLRNNADDKDSEMDSSEE
jgi:hypothetical protein